MAPLDGFARRLVRLSWFAAAGQPPADESDEARRYLDALGFAATPVAFVADWRAAEAVTRDPAWTPAWWEAEDRQRRTLLAVAARTLGEDAALRALTRVTDAASDVVFGAASAAAARAGVADPALARVAAGAATQAAYQAALAELAGAGADHAFAAKFRLFAAGRWPLALVRGAFHVF